MEHILIIGATGQIGSELTMELRKRYGNANVVAGYIPGAEPKGELKESGPSAIADVTDGEAIASVVKEYHIDTIYNLAALLSVVAESKPKLAWKIGIDGLWNVLEVAREQGCAVFTPSSIGSFGASTPHTKTPQDTIQRPRTMYGVTKVTTELLSDYYFNKYGVDTRAVRFPGIISNVTPPGGGTTDYAVDIYYFNGYDVHAGCAECSNHTDGSRSGKIDTPQCFQYRFHEFRSGNDISSYQEACAAV